MEKVKLAFLNIIAYCIGWLLGIYATSVVVYILQH